MARPQENILLADADRQALEAVLRSHKTPQSRALRARIVLKGIKEGHSPFNLRKKGECPSLA